MPASLYSERRAMPDVLLDLADRMGPEFKKKYLHFINMFWALEGNTTLNVDENYTWEQINDKICRNFFGDEHGLDWFKKNGGLEWPKQPEEAYWRYEIGARVPLYWEFIIKNQPFHCSYDNTEIKKNKSGLTQTPAFFYIVEDFLK